jgi:hypothetical protein
VWHFLLPGLHGVGGDECAAAVIVIEYERWLLVVSGEDL